MQTVNSMQQARMAIRAGHLSEARRLMRQLVRDDPQNHVAWLLLARATTSPQAARAYVKRAEAIRPDSSLVQSELLRLDKKYPKDKRFGQRLPWQKFVFASSFLIVFLLLGAWLIPLGLEQVAALKDNGGSEFAAPLATITPVSMSDQVALLVTDEPPSQPTPTLGPATNEIAPVVESNIEGSPTFEVPGEDAEVAGGLDLETDNGQDVGIDTALPEVMPVEEITEVAEVELPEIEVLSVEESTAVADEHIEPEIVESAPVAQPASMQPNSVGFAERWIDVNLNTQTLVAYEGETPVFSSLISSGMWNTPTVTGQYRTNMKYESQDMNGYLLGYDYYLEDVPYVMYFFEDYAIHGAYWHNSFGTPMSHGCVNMNPVDAGWLYNWAPVGTIVNIHH